MSRTFSPQRNLCTFSAEWFSFFGYVIGDFEEWGNFSLNELQSVRVRGLAVERDLYFKQGPLSEVLARFGKERGE